MVAEFSLSWAVGTRSMKLTFGVLFRSSVPAGVVGDARLDVCRAARVAALLGCIRVCALLSTNTGGPVPLSSEYGTCKTVKARFWR